MSAQEIDIESLQYEILAAESYLRHNDPEVRTSLSRIDGLRKSDILQQLGRRPLSSSSSVVASAELEPTNYYDTHESNESGPNSPDSVDLDAGNERGRESRESFDSSNRYKDPQEREALISRLVATHRGAPSGGSSSSYLQYDGPDDRDGGREEDDEEDGPASANRDDEGSGELFFASDLPTPYTYPYPFEQGGAEDQEQMLTLRVRQAWGDAPQRKSDGGVGDKSKAAITSRSNSSSDGGGRDRAREVPGRAKGVSIKAPDRGRSSSSGRSGSSGGSDGVQYRDREEDDEENDRQHEEKDDGPRFRYLKSRDDLAQEAESDFQRKFRFTPAISKRVQRHRSAQASLQAARSGSNGNNSGAGGSGAGAGLAARIDDIHRKHQSALENRERTRRETERQELADCTFRPAICKNTDTIIARMAKAPAMVIARDPDAPPAAAAAQRLHSEAATRAEQQRSLQHRVLEARQQQYTFQPAIATAASAAGRALDANVEHRPIYERVAEMQRYSTKRLADLRQSHEAQQSEGLTFRPQIDRRSRQMAQAMQTTGERPAGERLHEEKSRQQRRHQQRLMQHARIEADNAKHPQLSRGTTRLAQSAPSLQHPFDARQQQYQQTVQRRSDARRKQEEDAQEAWFRPEIGKSSAIVAVKRPELLSETDDERSTRLSAQDVADMAARRAAVEREAYKDVTFKPALDPVSAALGKKSSLQDLVDNPKGKSVRERARRQQQEVEEGECSFHPQVLEYRLDASASSSLYGAGTSSYRYDTQHSIDGWASQTMLPERDARDSSGVVQAKINIKEPEKMARDIRLHLQEREERRRAELMARELEALRECTFAPSVQPPPLDAGERPLISFFLSLIVSLHPTPPPLTFSHLPLAPLGQPIVVRGLGRHLELRHLSIKQREEREEREREVFSVKGVDRLRRQEDGGTILRPFALSHPNPRPSAAAVQSQQESEAECTFVPVTSHVLRREVISRQARAVF